MIELTEAQRQAVDQGEPVRACLEGRDVVLLRTEIYCRIQSTLEVERAVIAATAPRAVPRLQKRPQRKAGAIWAIAAKERSPIETSPACPDTRS